jgi:hypothetical protein
MAKPNHGSFVSSIAHVAQAERPPEGPQGIGPVVSEAARNKEAAPDFTDETITVLDANGEVVDQFYTFADALAAANNDYTLQVGAGVYDEVINLTERVTIIGEEGAILDGSTRGTDAGTQGTIQLFEGFSGGSISGLTVNAVQGGQALLNFYGVDVNDVTLTNNTFDAGNNTSGSLVYLNPGADGFDFIGNTFVGESLEFSPLLGIEGDDINVIGNEFGDIAAEYKVGVDEGANGTYEEVVFSNNKGLQLSNIDFA